MQYCLDPNVDEPIFIIDTHFGFCEDDGQGIDGSLFLRELMEVDGMGKKRIQVWICSPGGNVMEGYKVFNAMLMSKTKVDTYAFGVVASIAAVVFQAGRNRLMADYALLMYHDPIMSDGTDGGPEMDRIRKSLVKMIATKSGKDFADIEKIMAQTTWIDAEEALEMGLCDSIEASEDKNKKRIAVTTDARAMWVQSKALVNSIIPKKNISNMFDLTKINNKLGLVKDANEDSIMNAINAIENKSKGFGDAVNKADAETAKWKAKCEDLEAKMKAMEDKAKEAEDKAKVAEEAKNEADITDAINSYVKVGKIKNEATVITEMKAMAKTSGLVNFKKIVDALPIVAKAPRIENAKQELPAGKVPTNAANMSARVMAKVSNRFKK